MLSLLTAALTGLFAAAVPTILQESPCLTAFAGSGGNLGNRYSGEYIDNVGSRFFYEYYDNSDGVTIYSAEGEYRAPGFSVTIPDTLDGKPVTTIGARAFNGKKFRSITLPETVKVIEPRAFEACTITSISLPQSLETIGAYAFSRAWLGSVTIPAGVKTIEEATFYGCDRLTSVTLEGAEQIEVNAFLYCTNITSLTIPDNCVTVGREMAFSECKNLDTINGYQILTHATDENGISYPVLDPHCHNVINQHFSRCLNVGFIDTYCTELCEYVVATETDQWMNDALKARQLHDWLINHCNYDHDYVSSPYDLRHYIYSSFFLSFGTSSASDQLNDKTGLTVCEGYAKAYTMLLTACGIESYVVNNGSGSNGHAFNAVKIRNGGTDNLGHPVDRYYQVDVTWDDGGSNPISYAYFLKSDADMNALHNGKYPLNRVENLNDEHTLLNVYKAQNSNFYKQLKAQCSESLRDDNHDGIQDYDLNLDGYWTNEDWSAFTSYLRFAFGFDKSIDDVNDRLGDVLANLHALHMGYGQYVYESAPQNASAPAGGTAEFRVRLFGDNLTYQWKYYDKQAGAWCDAPYDGATDAVLRVPANSETHNMKFVCYIWNQNGYYLYSNPVTLTVL